MPCLMPYHYDSLHGAFMDENKGHIVECPTCKNQLASVKERDEHFKVPNQRAIEFCFWVQGLEDSAVQMVCFNKITGVFKWFYSPSSGVGAKAFPEE
ncbi:unnamed protein product [Urochloa humidicola]